MALRACQGKCGKSYEDHGEAPPTMPDDEVSVFLCFGCSLSYAVWCQENGHEDAIPKPVPGVKVEAAPDV